MIMKTSKLNLTLVKNDDADNAVNVKRPSIREFC